jgi:hypothetical protein
MKIWLTALAFVSTVALGQTVPIPGQPQDGNPSIETPGELPMTYVGANDRVSVGIDKDGKTQGELMGVFGRNDEHAVVAQAWWEHGGAGGFQTDYNWLLGVTPEQAKLHPEAVTVAKLSFGMNQDEFNNRQAAAAFSIERKQFFIDAYLAAKASGAHDAGELTSALQNIQNGTDVIGNFTQTTTTTTTTALQSQPYSYSTGLHGGHFSDALAARFQAGVDYDKGKQGAYETRASVGIDKYIGTRGWSLSGLAEHADEKDPMLVNRSDNRWWLMVRYEFGGNGAFVKSDQAGDSAWITRALGEPVITTPHTLRTYTSRGKVTTTTTPGNKQYTAHRPVAQADTATVQENSANNAINVLANDSDADGNPISITAVTAPAHGVAQIAGGQINYTPAAGYAGTDQFNYTISDNKGLAATTSVTVTVMASQAPTARNETTTTPFNTPITVNVLANDSDPNGYALGITSITQPAHGSAAISGGTIVYTPQPTFSGTDTFSYTVGNGHGGTATATVTVTVQPPGAPIVRNDTATTPYATPVVIDVLANDSDPNNFPLSIIRISSPAQGTDAIQGNTIVYSPSTTLNGGTDKFSYTVSDGHGNTANGVVTVTVQAPGAPSANNDTATTAYNTPVTINVLSNDTDPNGFALTVASVTTPSHGSAQVSNNSVVYTPVATFYGGADSFSYTVSDGHGGTASATVNVTVSTPLPPRASNYAVTLQPQTIVGLAVVRILTATVNVLANDSDPNNFPLTVTSLGPSKFGSLVNNGDGTVKYTEAGVGNFGPDAFTYTISDGHGGTATGTVTLSLPTLTVSTNIIGNGSITPGSAAVLYGNTTTFTLKADPGWVIDPATTSGGNCGGALNDSTFATGAILENCTVTAGFVVQTIIQ